MLWTDVLPSYEKGLCQAAVCYESTGEISPCPRQKPAETGFVAGLKRSKAGWNPPQSSGHRTCRWVLLRLLNSLSRSQSGLSRPLRVIRYYAGEGLKSVRSWTRNNCPLAAGHLSWGFLCCWAGFALPRVFPA